MKRIILFFACILITHFADSQNISLTQTGSSLHISLYSPCQLNYNSSYGGYPTYISYGTGTAANFTPYFTFSLADGVFNASGGSVQNYYTYINLNTFPPRCNTRIRIQLSCGTQYVYSTTVLNQFIDPNPSNVLSETICSGGNIIQEHIFGVSPTASVDYSWTTFNVSNVTGESTTSQNGNIITDNLVNLTNTNQSVLYTIKASKTGVPVSQGCFVTKQKTIIVKPSTPIAPTISISSGQAALCQGGTAQLSYTMPTNAGYSPPYTWNTGQTSNPITVNQPGNYSITASNGCGNAASNIIEITLNPFTVNASASSASLTCGNNTQLQAEVTNAQSNVNYSWTPNAGTLTGANTANPIANPINTRTYTVTATSNGCSVTDQITITVNPFTLNISASNTTLTCGNTSLLQAEVGTGVSNVSYTWSPASGLNNSNIANPIASPSSNTTYTVTAVASNGCSATGSFPITVTPYIIDAQVTASSISCGTSTQLSTTVSPNVSNTVNYSWSPTTGLSNPNIANPVATPNSTTNYTVTATTASGCTASDQVSVNVTPPNFTVNALVSGSPVECGSSVYLNAQLSTAISGATYSWSPATGLSNPNIATPSASPRENTTYTVTVTTPDGCVVTDEVNVIVQNNNPQSLFIDNGGSNGFACENGVNLYVNSSSNYENYQWSHGPTTFSITVNAAGTYTVTATLLSGNYAGCLAQGSTTLLPLATINAPNGATLCNGGSVILEVTGNNLSSAGFFWSNGETTQNITVTQPGNYSCNVVRGNCSYTANITVTNASGTFTPAVFTSNAQNNNTVSFSYNDPNISSATWDFGDGNTSTEESPTHVYASSGQYNVCLTATNFCGVSGTVCQNVTATGITGIEEEEKSNPFTLFPNPATSNITIQFQNEIQSDLVTIYSISGQKVLQEKITTENNQFHVNTSNLQSGIYFVEIGNARMKFVVE